MSFSKVYSAQIHLLKVYKVDIEIDLSKGLNAFNIVGLPDKAVAEAKDRVSAAIKNCGYKSPKKKNQKVVVSLAPADIKKEGPNFDLAIALAYLLATDDIRFGPDGKVFLGELSLDGKIRPIKGALPLTIESKKLGFKEIYLPEGNIEEARIVKGIKIFGISHLKQIIFHLNLKESNTSGNDRVQISLAPSPIKEISYQKPPGQIDFKDIKGNKHAKRALEISAAGNHNLMMYGPPGTGKTMLAKAFSNILPKLTFEEIIETTSIYSSIGLLQENLITYPPFRTPHHTASYISLIGGGANPKPGEVTLAHKGVLFIEFVPQINLINFHLYI
jgi:magnesium chelatase family protein